MQNRGTGHVAAALLVHYRGGSGVLVRHLMRVNRHIAALHLDRVMSGRRIGVIVPDNRLAAARTARILAQAQRIDPRGRRQHIAVLIDATQQADGIGTDITG